MKILATNIPSIYQQYESLHIEAHQYTDGGRLNLRLVQTNTGELYTTITVNLPDEECPEDEIFVKNYSENANIEPYLLRHNIITGHPTYIASSGWIDIPRYKLHPNIVRNLKEPIPSNS